jgi:hypothetical protein
MHTYNSTELLINLRKDVEATLAYCQNELSKFDVETLSLKPSADKWSIAECLEHLNIYSRHYLSRHEKGLNNSSKCASCAFTPGYFGEKFTKMMKPLEDGSLPSTMSTMKKFDPAKTGTNNPKALQEFIQHQKTFLAQLESAKGHNLNNIRITSTLGPILRFKIGDSFRFLIAHEQRHLLQIKKTVQVVSKLKIAS